MSKIKVTAKKIWLGALIVLIFIIIIEKNTGLKLVVGGIDGRFILLVLGILTIGLPMYFFDYSKEKEIKIAFNILACLIIAVSIFFYVLFLSEIEYFYFKSPDKKRTLVVEEVAGFRSANCFFYENKHGVFIKPLNKSTDMNEPHRPFTSKEYKMNWINNNTVKIEYFSSYVLSGNVEVSF